MQDGDVAGEEAEVLTGKQLEAVTGGEFSGTAKRAMLDAIYQKKSQGYDKDTYIRLYKFKKISPQNKAAQIAFIEENWDSVEVD